MATRTIASPTVSARFERALDGDTFVMRLAWTRSFEKRASIEHVRLNGYRAREMGDVAAQDPAGLGRIPGPAAAAVAVGVLAGAAWLEVTVRGIDEYGRVLGDVMTPLGNLGPQLADQRAVVAGSTRGLES